ncbi:transcription factor HES-5-like [Sebastes umbrosus]|uniref:transcription factor HES-5-like n=1 Tax=Sebastes umbrosus TaxID=72105 RepID=UPI00189CECDD|nr:transcription factor HES-5-like [Sebastes umbrosus]
MAPVTETRPENKPASVDISSSNKLRKLSVEKLRRDRINRSIEQLRVLLNREEPSGGPQQPSSSRLEKADILQLSVGFLRQRALLARVAPSYSRGFSQCLQETLRHLSLHSPLQPADREHIKRFYVLQRAALHRHMSGEQGRPSAARKRSNSRSSSRCHGSLWRPW